MCFGFLSLACVLFFCESASFSRAILRSVASLKIPSLAGKWERDAHKNSYNTVETYWIHCKSLSEQNVSVLKDIKYT